MAEIPRTIGLRRNLAFAQARKEYDSDMLCYHLRGRRNSTRVVYFGHALAANYYSFKRVVHSGLSTMLKSELNRAGVQL